ncbi:MAG: tRNA epoxyqueuosine(34) reductase QueG [Acidobacteriales bacterium]|nr:tRNA epoxyqueuosine(34) reductase QueG [Terriglobales bacterium]
MNPSDIVNLIKDAAHESGFELAGVSPIRDFPELEYFPQWVIDGYAGEMKYMEATNDTGELKRRSVKSTFPWAQSVVLCAINYNTAYPYSIENQDLKKGWIARYSWGQQDYHDAVMRRLRVVESRLRECIPDELTTRCYVDTGPILERVYAKYAGIGWVGKNTCILNQELGSWLFLGVILASLELPPDDPVPDRCGSCTRCIEACPTDALVEPYKLDANRCISYLTIEKKGGIPAALREGVGRNVFGCDICQDVCPWNREAPATRAAEFQPREGLVNPDLEWLAEITAQEFQEKFRGSAIKRAKRNGVRRNAITAMGNSRNQSFVPALERLTNDEDPVVAEAAVWAANKLTEISDK